ncbi:uncharacterized protein JCM10292_001703 [Rhodotorula paludigena]|uniref:uncharacterized protein n=1 Tax=Rhodotorula paludigena TaxID=86838 RepID=UPI00317CCB04
MPAVRPRTRSQTAKPTRVTRSQASCGSPELATRLKVPPTPKTPTTASARKVRATSNPPLVNKPSDRVRKPRLKPSLTPQAATSRPAAALPTPDRTPTPALPYFTPPPRPPVTSMDPYQRQAYPLALLPESPSDILGAIDLLDIHELLDLVELQLSTLGLDENVLIDVAITAAALISVPALDAPMDPLPVDGPTLVQPSRSSPSTLLTISPLGRAELQQWAAT